MSETEKQTVHDWTSGELVVYEIDAPVETAPSNPDDSE